jgi:hypothetical protein
VPNDHWPKLTADWMVANPLIGTFGTLDTDAGARRVVVASTRNGQVLAYRTTAPPCEGNADHPLGSWPKFHHDLANSGDYGRDAVDPGKPFALDDPGGNLSFRAPGDDLLCGKVARYEAVQADFRIDRKNFDQGDPIPTDAINGSNAKGVGQTQTLELGGRLERYLAMRAVDEQGNIGPTVTVSTRGQGGRGVVGGLHLGGGGTCRDRRRPQTAIRNRPLRHTRKGLTVKGHTSDNGCRKLAEARRRNRILVSVSIAKRAGRKCRFLERDGTLSRRRSCRRPTKLRAKGKYSLKKHRLTWRYHTGAKLPKGRYVVIALAVDQSGNAERRVSHRNRKTFRVRRSPRRSSARR